MDANTWGDYSVEFPEGHVQTFDNNPDVQTVERDNEVRTQ